MTGSLGLISCGASLKHFPFDHGRTISTNLGLEIIFYSVCCVQIRSQIGSIICDPFFTHLPFLQVAFGKCLPDFEKIEPFISDFHDVKGVLIGHNHYDHNMALPAIDPHLHPSAVHLGTRTMAHTFAASELKHPLISLNDTVATPENPGKWWTHPSGTFRVLPILSGHPSQYLFIHLFTKRLTEPRDKIPSRANHYQEGVTLAFLLDFLDEGKVKQRIYIQSSSTGYPAGFFPESIKSEKSVDVAILAMDSANIHMKTGTSVLDFLEAPVVFFTHYEDFFRSKERHPREIVKVDLPKTHAFFKGHPNQKTIFSAYDQRYQL